MVEKCLNSMNPTFQYSIIPLFHSLILHFIPAILASTSNKIAKSFSASPMPRAAVSISLVIAVVGSGTSSWRPISNASNKILLHHVDVEPRFVRHI